MLPKIKHYRFAPSPTHYMHQGNAVSACLNYLLAQRTNGRFTLRIEDIDHNRCRPEYIQAIYDDLDWLGVKWHDTVHDTVRLQSNHLADYDNAIDKLAAQTVLYGCQCSRKTYQDFPHYPATCRNNIISSKADLQAAIMRGNAIRINCDIACRRVNITPDPRLYDEIIRRRDIGTSYHIAVVVDDGLQGITDIVRGSDLADATPLHLLLQRLLSLPQPDYYHHPLINNPQGEKLSKSAQNNFRHHFRVRDMPRDHYWRMATQWAIQAT